MVIDTSAVVAILQNEPESRLFRKLIEDDATRLLSACSAFEASMVVLTRQGEPGLELFRRFLAVVAIETVAFDGAQVELAVDAFRRFGRGSPPGRPEFWRLLLLRFVASNRRAAAFQR